MEFKHGDKVVSNGEPCIYVGSHPNAVGEHVLSDSCGGIITSKSVSKPKRVLKKGDHVYVRDDKDDLWSDVNGNSSVTFHGMYDGFFVCLDHGTQGLRGASLWSFAIHVDDA